MKEPKWVTSAEVARINEKETALTDEPFGILKPGELESACDRARNHFTYGETDLHRLAATYAEGVAQNHPFEQGNKRSAFTAAAYFLAKNGVELLPREDDSFVVMMRELVIGERSRDDVAAYFSENSRELIPEHSKEAPAPDDLLQDYASRHAPKEDGHDLTREHDMARDPMTLTKSEQAMFDEFKDRQATDYDQDQSPNRDDEERER